MELKETLKQIKRIRREITDERDISYGDTVFLQENQDIIKDYFNDDPVLYQWAGIPENLYGQKTRYRKGEFISASATFEINGNRHTITIKRDNNGTKKMV